MGVRRLFATALLPLVTACVYADSPVGLEPLALDPDEWGGSWIHGEGTAVSTVVDAAGGILELQGVGLADDEGPATVELRSVGGTILASVLGEGGYYLWALVVRRDAQIVLFLPDVEAFGDLVDARRLPGRTEDSPMGKSVYLEGLEALHMEPIAADHESVQFEWREPTALIHRR